MAARVEIKAGDRFGRLVAIRSDGPAKKGVHVTWLFRCDCGQERHVRASRANDGSTQSCGCLGHELSRERGKAKATHGFTRNHQPPPEYRAWQAMKERCYYPNFIGYDDYGGRGIIVCDRWRNSFENFYADLGKRPSSKHSIDRIDVNGNYEPGNVRWATRDEQSRNHRRNLIVEYAGKTMCLKDAAAIAGIKITTVKGRLARGWTPEEALSEPHKSRAA